MKGVLHTITAFLASAALMALPLTTSAAEPGWFAALNLGNSDYDVSLSDFSGLDDGSLMVTEFDHKDTAYSISGGLFFNEYLGVEVGYINMGEADASAFSNGLETYPVGDAALTFETDGFKLGALGSIPLGSGFDLQAQLGYFAWDSDASIAVNDTDAGNAGDSGSDFYYGLGIGYGYEIVNYHLSYTRYDVEETHVDVLALGFRVGFGF